MSDWLSFQLSDEFVESYADVPVAWGFPIHDGLSLGELTYINKYSRIKDDGAKERWHETCRRVIEGMFSIQKDWCKEHRTPWNDHKAQRSAQDAFERMFTFKWLPPGRGLQHMGTQWVHENRNSAPLNNCAFISTEKLSTHSLWAAIGPFVRLMEMSMNGVGVGFCTAGAGKLTIHQPADEVETFVVPDTREGWAESMGALLGSFFFPGKPTVKFDYSLVRPQGALLKTFGGRASGPEPLMDCHEMVRYLLLQNIGATISSRDITDVMNLEGKAVVSGGARRSAEVAIGSPHDADYINLKNWELPENAERTGEDGWAWNSNNSVYAELGEDYSFLIEKIKVNGEPGLFWLDLAQGYGRMIDPRNDKDWRASGSNPCMEQTLENNELCTLVETFPTNHDTLDDYIATLKVAYLYGKSVTLLPTPWPESNEVMARNRRIGCSMSGLAQFVEDRGWSEMRNWMDEGYNYICKLDTKYSEWLAVRESIKKTSIKPSGTVSLLAGVTPGVHWPTFADYIRRVRYSADDPMVEVLVAAGYKVEPARDDPKYTVVAEFPIAGPGIRSEQEVNIWEKAELAVLAQRWWADNQVSVTVSFMPDEADQIAPMLASKEGQLKSISFLPIDVTGTTYEQAPYEPASIETIEAMKANLAPLDLNVLYGEAREIELDKFCDNDVCTI